MTILPELPPQYCLYAIYGHAFVATREGGFWEPEDELKGQVTSAAGGLLVVSCETPDDSIHVRMLLDEQRLVAGVDYGIGCRHSEQLTCPGIVFEDCLRGRLRACGESDWKVPPMPEHIRSRHEAEYEKSQAGLYDLFRGVASMVDVDPIRLVNIDRMHKASARNRELMFAMRSKGDGRG